MNIYEYFNSRDIAAHCKNIGHTFTSIETAYLVWHSNHHTLEDKHRAWQEIIETMPDESFRPNWDFGGHTLRSFLRTYMRLQNSFIESFGATGYIYTYSVLNRYDDEFQSYDVSFDSFEACMHSLKVNELDDDTSNEIAKVKITRHKINSSAVSFRDAQESETIVSDKHLHPLDVIPASEVEGDMRFLSPSNGFYEMWVAIPTPFKRGDVVMDVDYYDYPSRRHKPFLLDRIPYWKKGALDGTHCEDEVERLLRLGVDWTDMQECVYFQDDNGEIYWDHAFDYLDLEYYRDEPVGTEKFLCAVGKAMQGEISVEELLRVHSIVLMENYASEMRKYFDGNQELLQLCGVLNEQ